MVLMFIIVISGSFLGYIIAKKRNGKFLDRLQYTTIFGIIFFLISIVIQIIIMRLNIF